MPRFITMLSGYVTLTPPDARQRRGVRRRGIWQAGAGDRTRQARGGIGGESRPLLRAHVALQADIRGVCAA